MSLSRALENGKAANLGGSIATLAGRVDALVRERLGKKIRINPDFRSPHTRS